MIFHLKAFWPWSYSEASSFQPFTFTFERFWGSDLGLKRHWRLRPACDDVPTKLHVWTPKERRFQRERWFQITVCSSRMTRKHDIGHLLAFRHSCRKWSRLSVCLSVKSHDKLQIILFILHGGMKTVCRSLRKKTNPKSEIFMVTHRTMAELKRRISSVTCV